MRYGGDQTKPDPADGGQKLVEDVLADLEAHQPDGITAFQAFVAEIADRCDVPPSAIGGGGRRRIPLSRPRPIPNMQGFQLLAG